MLKTNPMAVFRAEFDNSGILFNPENGDIFALNPTGKIIWQAIENGATDEAAVLAKLAEACEGELPEQAAADVHEFIEKLEAKGFLADE